MNYFKTFLIFLLQMPVLTQAFAQYDTTVVNTYFTKITESDTANYAIASLIPNGTKYLMLENAVYPSGQYVMFYTLDSIGNKLDSNFLFTDNDLIQLNGGKGVVYTSKNTVVSSFALYNEVSDYDFILFEMDTLGNFIWQKKFDWWYHENVSQIIETQDGGYLLVGGYEPIGGSSYLWALKLDENGETEWNKVLTELDTWSTALSVIEYNDFYLFWGGGAFNLDTKPLVVKLSKSGEFINEYHIEDENFSCRCSIYPKANSPDLFYVASCLNPWDDYYALMDTNFNIIWEKIVINGGMRLGISLPDMLPNGHLMYVGSTNDDNWDQIYMVERDTTFEIVSAKKIQTVDNKHVYARDMRKTSDGGYIIAAYEHYPLPQRGWVIKTDSLGNTCYGENCDSVIYTIDTLNTDALLELNRYATVYPNPVQDELTLMHSLSTTFNTLTWKVTDTYGREVWAEELDMRNARIPLNVGHLNNGLYFYQLLDKNEIIRSGKFVVQR